MDRDNFEKLLTSGAFVQPPQQPVIQPPTLKPLLSTISSRALHETYIPPVRWIVQDIIPSGLTLLASPPKYGKSWMMLDLCLSVAQGSKFLGYDTEQGEVLYLALEDSLRRLKERMGMLLHGNAPPEGINFCTSAGTIDTTLLHELETHICLYVRTKLIIIDTFQKVRGGAQIKETAYGADYREISMLKQLADKYDIAIILVHHLRKMKDESDPFNMISGTNGILGAADTTLVLTRESRTSENTTLSAVGRDIESLEIVLNFDKDRCKWVNLGDMDWVTARQEKDEYNESPIVKTVVRLVKQSPENSWKGTAKDLLDAGRYIIREEIAYNSRDLSAKLKKLERFLMEFDGIIHERKSNGSGGGKHLFYIPRDEYEDVGDEPVPFEGG